MNNIGLVSHSVKKSASPKGFGGDRKAPEMGREPAPLTSRITGRKNAPVGRCFLRVQEDSFSGAAFGFVHVQKSGRTAFAPYSFLVQRRGSSLTRRTRLCLELRLGLCPKNPPGLPRPGPRNALRGLVYCFVRPRRKSIFFPALCCLWRNCAVRARTTPLPAGFFTKFPLHLKVVFKSGGYNKANEAKERGLYYEIQRQQKDNSNYSRAYVGVHRHRRLRFQ